MTEISKKGYSLLKITLIQFALIYFCFLLTIFFGILTSNTIFAYSKLPKDIETYSESARLEEIKKIEAEFKSNKNNQVKSIEEVFYLIKESPSLLLVNNFTWFLSFIIPALILFKFILDDKQNDLTDELNVSKIFAGMKVGIVLFSFILVLSLFFMLIHFEPKVPNFVKELYSSLKGNHYLLAWSIYSVGIMTGILEELFFRGFLLNQYMKHGFQYEGLFITSSIFGVMHYSDEGSILVPIIITLVGFVLGLVYIKTKNIWVSISAHSTYNSFILISAYLFGDKLIK